MRSVLQPGICNLQFIYALGYLGATNVWTYQSEGRQMRMSELSVDFFELLLEKQKYQAGLIANDIVF